MMEGASLSESSERQHGLRWRRSHGNFLCEIGMTTTLIRKFRFCERSEPVVCLALCSNPSSLLSLFTIVFTTQNLPIHSASLT